MKKTILLACAILGLAFATKAQIDAAVKVGDSLYFFKGANCVTYSLITKTVRNQPISTVWPSLAFSSDISSAFMLKDKLIFTKGTTYVEWDIQKKRGDIPQVINSGNFGFSSLDAAFAFPNSDNGGEGIEGKVYFLKSSVYSRSDLYDGVLDQTNKANSGWTGLGWSTIDAALTDDKNRVYFFKGDELAIVNVASKTVVSKSKIKVIFQLPSSWFTSTPSPPVSTTPPTTPPTTTSTSVSSGSEITIGTQTWKTKNLDVKYYRDGTEIEHVTSSSRWTTTTTGAWCYYDNDPSKGVLYNGYAVNDKAHGGIAPAGWHVPARTEWATLFNFYGGNYKAGSKIIAVGGLNAFLGGRRNKTTGNFSGVYNYGTYWCSTPQGSIINVFNNDTIKGYHSYESNYGFSVRLIKDKISSKNSEITIGTQTWKTKNLDVKTYRDGTEIEHVTSNSRWTTTTTGAWCYYDNDPSKGVLYNGYAVNDKVHGGIAPAGWHVPTETEWKTLFNEYGGMNKAGINLKKTSGFNAFMEGARNYKSPADFYQYSDAGRFWSSSNKNSNPPENIYYKIFKNIDTIKQYDGKLNFGFSVRLIKDKVSSNTSGITTNNSVVKIGNQTWMANDLNVKTYRDGTPIRQVQNNSGWVGLKEGAWCYYDNANPSKGILYNWYAVNDEAHGGLAPIDWYIPTKAELTTLTSNGINMLNSQFVPGKGGYRDNTTGGVGNSMFVSYYWSSEPNPIPSAKSAWALRIENTTNVMKVPTYDLNYGLSVRCIQRVVEIKEAITGWPEAAKRLEIDRLTKFLSSQSSTEIKQISDCMFSEIEIKYFDYNKFKKLSDDDKFEIEKSAYRSCLKNLSISLEYIKIGTQLWSRKDLEVTMYRDGTIIPQVQSDKDWKSLKTGAWCYYDNNNKQLGKLYNWYAVTDSRGLAPKGWHIPSDADWFKLATALGGQPVAGGKMKQVGTLNWKSPNPTSNHSGWEALPGGKRDAFGKFSWMFLNGQWWSSTETETSIGTPSYGWSYRLYFGDTYLFRIKELKRSGFQIRCIKD